MSTDYNYSKVLLEFVQGMKKVILDLEALIENHPICNCTEALALGAPMDENEAPAQEEDTKIDDVAQGNSNEKRKRPCLEE